MSSPACTLSPVSLCCQEWLKLQNFWLWGRVRSTVLFYSAAKKARFYPAPDGALDFYASHGGVLVRSAPLVGIFTFFPASARRNQFLSATPKTDGGTPRRRRRRGGKRGGRWGERCGRGLWAPRLGRGCSRALRRVLRGACRTVMMTMTKRWRGNICVFPNSRFQIAYLRL